MAVAADHHVDARHGLGQVHVFALGESPVFPFLHAAVAETDDHIHLFRLAENLHHLPGGLDGVGERSRTATGVDGGLLAEQPKDAEANAPALDHEMAADHPLLGQALEVGQRRVVFRKSMFDATIGGVRPALAATANGRPQPVRPEVELMVAEGGGVVAHPGEQLQFPAGLAGRRAERGPVAVVAIIEHQHRALSFARRLPLRDQGARRANPPRVLSSFSEKGV